MRQIWYRDVKITGRPAGKTRMVSILPGFFAFNVGFTLLARPRKSFFIRIIVAYPSDDTAKTIKILRLGVVMASDYTVDKIKIMEGLDAVRMRPGMYIGSTGQRGLHHLLWEIIDNAIDEAANGYANEIAVTLHKDNSVTVTDNGRGIPVQIHEKAGVSGVEVVFTQLHAGGKFGNDSYGYSGGLHGVGASVVNALSEWLEVEVCTDAHMYSMRFTSEEDATGKIISGKAVAPLEEVCRTKKQGTSVTFLPDARVFETIEMSYDIISKRIRELSYLNRGTKMILSDERPGHQRKVEYQFNGGLSDFVAYLNGDKTPLYDPPIHFSGTSGDIIVEAALQHNDGYADNIFSYVNNIPTTEGGTHETGFKAALTKVLNDYCRKMGYLKDKDAPLAGEDFREGITAVLSLKMRTIQFEGQTKTKLGNTEARPAVESVVTEQLTPYLEDLKNGETAAIIAEKSVKAAKVREAARKAKATAREKNKLENAPLVGKLSSCTGRDYSKNELFIVEGDSAGGSAKQGRDRKFQAILPLRGKPTQCGEKAARSGAAKRRIPLDHHRGRNRHRRGLRHLLTQIRQDHHPIRRGSGRRAHPRNPFNVLLPLYEGTHHGRPCFYRSLSAVPGAKGYETHLLLRRRGATRRDEIRRQRLYDTALQRFGRDEPRTALGDNHEPRRAHADSRHHRGRGGRGTPRDRAHGRQGAVQKRIHLRERGL